MRSHLIGLLALPLLLGACRPGYYSPPSTPLHHFESANELHLTASLGWHGAAAWNPLFARDTVIDTNLRQIFFMNDSTDEWDERDTTTIDMTDRSRTLFISVSGSYAHFDVEGSGSAVRLIDGELAAGIGQRSNGLRVDAVAALGGGYYYAIDKQVISAWDYTYRYTAATLYHLRPSLSVSAGLTNIYGPTRSGIAFGVIGRVGYPIILSTTNDTLSRPRPLLDAGWYVHASHGDLLQVEFQVQFTGMEEIPLFAYCDHCGPTPPADIWSHFSVGLGLRFRFFDPF